MSREFGTFVLEGPLGALVCGEFSEVDGFVGAVTFDRPSRFIDFLFFVWFVRRQPFAACEIGDWIGGRSPCFVV